MTTQAAQKQEIQTYSERFVAEVQRQFVAEMGDALSFSDYEKTLAQHMYVKVDAALNALEAKREDAGKQVTPYKWENVNLQKLALDSVHRIGLGLDALIPNHLHVIPYFNKRIKKYDLDIRIGYVGKDFCRRKMAVEQPVDVIYQLVHEHDVFVPLMKSVRNEIEGYEFEIQKPFERGKVLGGFGYIMYADPKKNKLVLVTKRDFDKAKAGSMSNDFWSSEKWEEEMMYKTIVHRVAEKLPLDPAKVNAKSYAYVEAQEAEDRVDREIDENANSQPIDIKGTIIPDNQSAPESKQEAPQPEPQPAAQQQMNFPTDGPGY